MPLFPDALHDDVHVPLIDLADVATGERAVSTGRGAAHELRLLFEGVTGIGEAARAGYGELIAWTVGELLEAFYRGGGKVRRSGERPGDWELIRRACRWISGAAIPWRVPSGNVQPWAIMTLRSLPGERPALSDPVVFDVRLPPGAGPGPAVDRPALREAGRVSSPAFRIGVAVPSATWIPGRTRRPVRGVGGLWIGDASRYPVFSAHDRRRIAFGPESTHRPGGIDDAWHKSADAAGVVILDTEAVERRLDEAYPYLILDARYEKVRLDGVIQSQAVFIAIGINGEGRRQILGVELSNRESRSSWTTFVTSLKTRGLHGVEFVVSDDHAGLKRAVRELLPEAVWQRCYVHFLRNALDYLPRKADDDCRQELRWLYDRRNLKEAEQDLQAWLMRWATRYPKLTDWVEAHIGETLNFYSLPRQHHKHLKSTNMLERLNEEIKRRTRVVRIFPNAASCLRLVRALCAETHEGWLEDHRYLNMEFLKEQKKELRTAA